MRCRWTCLLVLAALALAGCGGVGPGDRVVLVNGDGGDHVPIRVGFETIADEINVGTRAVVVSVGGPDGTARIDFEGPMARYNSLEARVETKYLKKE